MELEKWKDKDGLTFNCGMINGGTALNVVPETCSFSVDIRFLTTEQMHEAEAFVKKIAETSFVEGSSCTVKLLSKRVAMDEKEETKYFKMLKYNFDFPININNLSKSHIVVY